jgi:hypothetical protein
MASENTGGFIGDLQEAFTPPAAGGCCGGPAPAESADVAAPATSCCGGTDEAGRSPRAEDRDQAPATSAAAAGDASGGCCG